MAAAVVVANNTVAAPAARGEAIHRAGVLMAAMALAALAAMEPAVAEARVVAAEAASTAGEAAAAVVTIRLAPVMAPVAVVAAVHRSTRHPPRVGRQVPEGRRPATVRLSFTGRQS
jgi:uncharacterized membrane protein YgcG